MTWLNMVVLKTVICSDDSKPSLVNRLSVDNEVALDLGCKLFARVVLAIFRNNRVSWLKKIIRDAKISHKFGKGTILGVFYDRGSSYAR